MYCDFCVNFKLIFFKLDISKITLVYIYLKVIKFTFKYSKQNNFILTHCLR